jgi:hypothetical protein
MRDKIKVQLNKVKSLRAKRYSTEALVFKALCFFAFKFIKSSVNGK